MTNFVRERGTSSVFQRSATFQRVVSVFPQHDFDRFAVAVQEGFALSVRQSMLVDWGNVDVERLQLSHERAMVERSRSSQHAGLNFAKKVLRGPDEVAFALRGDPMNLLSSK